MVLLMRTGNYKFLRTEAAGYAMRLSANLIILSKVWNCNQDFKRNLWGIYISFNTYYISLLLQILILAVDKSKQMYALGLNLILRQLNFKHLAFLSTVRGWTCQVRPWTWLSILCTGTAPTQNQVLCLIWVMKSTAAALLHLKYLMPIRWYSFYVYIR